MNILLILAMLASPYRLPGPMPFCPSGVCKGQVTMKDTFKLCIGTDCDYWLTYNSSGTQFDFYSTDGDGAGADTLLLTVEDGTNNVKWNANITWGDDTAWEDLRFPANQLSLAGNNDPNWIACVDDIDCLAFDDVGGDDEVGFFGQMPHSYKLESNISPHVHFGLEDTTSCNLRLCIEYSWAKYQTAFPSSTTECVTVATSGTADYHNMALTFSDISGSGMDSVSSMILGRFYRDGDDALDTCNGKEMWLYEIDFHYQIDSHGSDTELTK